MQKPIEDRKRLLNAGLPEREIEVYEPHRAGGRYWVDVGLGKQRWTVEYRPGKGFGLFDENAGYGEGPSEIYRTPERTARRLLQLMAAKAGGLKFNLKGV